LEQLGDDAVALMDTLGIDKVHWVGLSMGGMIGQSIALNHPDRLRSLVLCDTAATVSEEDQPVWQERIDTARDNGLEPLLQGTLERWFTPPFLSQNPPEVERIRKQYLATPVSGFIGCSEAIRRLNYLDRLHEINMPTLIIVGREDMGTPVALSEAMHERISNSRLVVIPFAAHLSNVEQPEAFTAALIDFLKGH
jgi:3-oxoadipate enol-lactonase